MIVFVLREMRATLLRMRYISFLLVLLFPNNTWWAVQESGVDSNLRGVCVVADRSGEEKTSIWASGSQGAVVRSTDSGKTWKRLRIAGAESLDFRGVQAFDAKTAYVMSSGEGAQSRIYKTTDGGEGWKLQYQGTRKEFFLDALICDDEKHCVALSDPVDGKFVILANTDGEHWSELASEKMPAALPKEGAFAASNSSLCLEGTDIYFGTGGPAARVFASHDFAKTWTVVETPIVSGNASSGIFSLYCDERTIVAVGGDYQDPGRAYKNAAVSQDGGNTWRLAAQLPGGYRSAVGRYNGGFVAVGPTGAEVSVDGLKWNSIGRMNFNAFAFPIPGNDGWAVGPHGTVAKFLDQTKYLI
ncbi:MAG TPA: YCF48-related protein [Candidatus Acidoferrum sp.]|nr:YCF48-related protein [Candidatus Acidoferrum sp.]